MIMGKSVLAIIPARGGSKGVVGKNIRPVMGKPLIAHTITVAKASEYIDRVILSTDSSEIAEVAARFGCEIPFMRDPSLASDTTSTAQVVVDALMKCPGYDYFVLLQPTSPLRNVSDVDGCILACTTRLASVCVSVVEAAESPFWMYRMDEGSTLSSILPPTAATRRQDVEKVYSLNGAVYFASSEWFIKHQSFISPSTIGYEMPASRSIDLDTEADFTYLEFITGE